ncbi:hypothetical protein V499_07838 [Pseudogymnoascus sp. VKM F-103]|nr:hypothetical protein V499_07838 [Pseudogymnoascus sp. VKM F-103]
MPSTKYVNGLIRYVQIQKPGRAFRTRKYTAEDQTHRKEHVSDITAFLGSFNPGDHEISESRGKHEEDPDEEEEESTSLSRLISCDYILVHPDRVVEAEENQCSGEGVPWKFNDDIASDKDLPRIGFRRPFADFV